LEQLENLQHTSCVRCKTPILGNPSQHLATCSKLERFDQASAQLYRVGYESLSLEQIELLFDLLLTTDLSGYIIADVISNKTQPLAEEGDLN
jgi:hypothetical protein